MNIGLLLAGGLGLRMEQSIGLPKQFFQMAEKPIIIHTLEIFEAQPEIDALIVVCLPSWEEYLRELLAHYGIRKVRWIVPGGDVRQQSVYNGLCALEKHCAPEDIVLVHDGVRPFITPALISENIAAVREFGTSMTATRCTDTLVRSLEGDAADEAMDRDNTYAVQTPQGYRLGYGLAKYREGYARGLTATINCCELFIALGESVHLVKGFKNNIKLTTREDIAFLKALYHIYNQEKDGEA